MKNHITARTADGVVVAFDLPFEPTRGQQIYIDGSAGGLPDALFSVGAVLHVVGASGRYTPQIAIRLETTQLGRDSH